MFQQLTNLFEASQTAESMTECDQLIIGMANDFSPLLPKYQTIRILKNDCDIRLYMVKNKENNTVSLLKMINKKSKSLVDKINHETLIVSSLRHPLVTKIEEKFHNQNYIFIVFKLFSSSCVPIRLNDMHSLSLFERKLIIAQLISCLLYFSKIGIVCGNLEPKNIFVDKMNRIVLLNFSESKNIQEDDDVFSFDESTEFSAPEIINRTLCGLKSDIWSLGVIALMLICNKEIFQSYTLKQLCDIICDNSLLFPCYLEEDEFDFLRQVLQKDSKKRMKSSDLIRHKYLTNGIRIDENFNITCEFTNGVHLFINGEQKDEEIEKLLNDESNDVILM